MIQASLLILTLVFVLMTLVWNLNRDFPKLPGDISIDRPGLRVYIPFLSAILVSVAITLYFNFFR